MIQFQRKEIPLPEYPRPQLTRDNWMNLNGTWEFQIMDGSQPAPQSGWRSILVPFALGSKLCGTDAQLLPGQILWYRRHFDYVPTSAQTMLNFEAVDQFCTVYLNGYMVGEHQGGYAPFSIDVTKALMAKNELLIRVRDDSDQGICAYGKQKILNGGMWYTPSSGIYGTVWLENLPEHAVYDIKITPDCEKEVVYLRMTGTFEQAVITVFEGERLVHRGITSDRTYTIPLPSYRAWSPSDPFLYRLYIQTEEETVRSYFGMRRFSKIKDAARYWRVGINGKPIFLSGLLDQGYTAEGLLTYPSEEAMRFELEKIKAMGFNMIRKHIKVENRRWYALCDQIGLLVMQDMPSGGHPYSFWRIAIGPTLGLRTMSDGPDAYKKNGREKKESRDMYMMELDGMLDTLYNCPCIFAWVPFNEGWGQFESVQVTEHIRAYDTTRLIDSASGWHDHGAGDFDSRHCYFRSFHMPHSSERIILLSEFGGYTYVEQGHGVPKKAYGYKKFDDKVKLNEAVFALYERDVLAHISKGLSGCVYTQIADVEDECNGLFTADRQVMKIDEVKMRRLNEQCLRSIK